jgi:hypothetical protein
MTTLDVCPLCEQSVNPQDHLAHVVDSNVCALCEQPVDLLDDVADVDDGEVSHPAHIHCPYA